MSEQPMNKQSAELTVEQKLGLLNNLSITEYDIYGDGGGYVMVMVDDETREALRQLGYDDQYIEKNKAETEGYEAEIDIWSIACDCGAGWFSANGSGFSVEEPSTGGGNAQ